MQATSKKGSKGASLRKYHRPCAKRLILLDVYTNSKSGNAFQFASGKWERDIVRKIIHERGMRVPTLYVHLRTFSRSDRERNSLLMCLPSRDMAVCSKRFEGQVALSNWRHRWCCCCCLQSSCWNGGLRRFQAMHTPRLTAAAEWSCTTSRRHFKNMDTPDTAGPLLLFVFRSRIF